MTLVDHLVVAVPDLDTATDDVEARTGVRPEYGGAHEGLGTHNALLSFDSCYLELIAPDPSQPDPATSRPFGVDQVSEASLVTFAVRPAPGGTIDTVVDAARASGHDAGPVVDMHRIRPDGQRLDWRLTLPAAVHGLVPFVIDWGSTPSPSSTAPAGVTLGSFEIRLPTADHDTRLRLAALDVSADIVDGSPAALCARLDGPAGSIEFRPAEDGS